MKTPQFILPLAHELVIDLFEGGGHIDIAGNHDSEAISLHTANHYIKGR